MTTTIALPPDADLTGSHQQTRPLPIDAVGYGRPQLLAAVAKGYQVGDENADGEQAGLLTLPTIEGASLDTITYVGSERNTEADAVTVATSHVLDFVADIEVNDLLLLHSVIWTDSTAAAPDTPSGWTLLVSWKDTNAYAPRITTWYRVATGSEAATQTVTHGTSLKMGLAMEAFRGVDTSNPFDVTEVGPVYEDGDDPDPGSITPGTDGAMVVAWGGVQEWPAQAITVPSGYTLGVDTEGRTIRSIFSAHKLQTTAAAEDPGSFTKSADRTVTGTLALRPATVSGDRTIIVAAGSADGTATTVAGSCTLDAIDEVQSIASTLVAGTFTLTLAGETTGNIDWDATAAAIETALEALPSVSAGDVVCSSGPLDESAVLVEFANGLGAQDVALMTASSGSVTITESQKGYAASTFDYEGDINMPRDGGANEPQGWLWSFTPSPYVAGRTITVDVGDHDALKTYAAVATVWSDLDTTTPVESIGAEATGTGTVADVGPITPTTRGARALAIVLKALSTGDYTSGQQATAPARTNTAASAVADSMTLGAFVTPPLDATAIDLGPSVWNGSELWAAAVASLRPADPPTGGLDLADVTAVDTTTSWVELASTAGDLYEVIEFDLAAVPPDAYIVGASVRFLHAADASHRIAVVPCAITAGGAVVLADDPTSGHRPEPLGDSIEVQTSRVDQLADGSDFNDYTRLGVAIRSTASAPGLTYHQLFWAELKLDILTGGPVVANVVGPVNDGDPITWDYSSAGGFPATHYQVMVIQGSGQDPDAATVGNPWGGVAGTIVYDSGRVANPTARELTITDHPLAAGTLTYAVRAWARMAGRLVPSDWATADADITGAAPTAPTVSSAASFDNATGAVSVGINTPADATRIFLHRSTDGGTTYELAADPVTVGASSSGTVVDRCPPLLTDVHYRIGVDSGDMSESTSADENGGSPRNWTPPEWYLQVLADHTLNVAIDVVAGSFNRRRRRNTEVVEGENGSAEASTAELGSMMSMTIRARTAAERAAIDAVLARTDTLRLATILGDSWYVRPVGDFGEQMQRWQPLASEATPIRNAHTLALELVETAAPVSS